MAVVLRRPVPRRVEGDQPAKTTAEGGVETFEAGRRRAAARGWPTTMAIAGRSEGARSWAEGRPAHERALREAAAWLTGRAGQREGAPGPCLCEATEAVTGARSLPAAGCEGSGREVRQDTSNDSAEVGPRLSAT